MLRVRADPCTALDIVHLSVTDAVPAILTPCAVYISKSGTIKLIGVVLGSQGDSIVG